ncbi:hypothetical protein [Mesorhizobium sp. KR9-304]|uniref:AAA family ATPase n=1 Tax=Mesorhizobium sp. KR9-304 TaxID=3156614 RepID=UPI0032B44080
MRSAERPAVIALDGHDGSGKTTLAKALAERMDARYVRTFGSPHGAALMAAYRRRDSGGVLEAGVKAVEAALDLAAGGPAVLDRGWLTVATLVPADLFAARWWLWVPTALLWCDLPTTLARLGQRGAETPETTAWHADFLAIYEDRRLLRDGPTIRTDLKSVEQCLDELETLLRESADSVASSDARAGRR